MNWLLLLFAGLLEIIWVVGLKYSQGFTKLIPSLITVAAMAASFYLLGAAIRSIPLGVAYAVWVGIGAVGAAVIGIFLLHEPVSLIKVVSLVMIVLGIIGMKLSSTS